jgi:hypothetical protein
MIARTRTRSLGTVGTIALAGLAAALLAMPVTPARAEVLKAGFLDCEIGPGAGLIVITQQTLKCTFYPNSGPAEFYAGHVQKFGLDAGVSAGEVITWAVMADQANWAPGSLAGTYAGATAGASLGIGVGVNALFGGSNQSIVLTPISVQGAVGIGVAVGITAIKLDRT